MPSTTRCSTPATGLPAGLSIDQKTGQITGTLDHDASAHGQTESGSGATLDGTYTIVVTREGRARRLGHAELHHRRERTMRR